ncbi:MAG: hybrid sensor histidine kinase/response regulator [Thiomargarita sp.]|nr:hybrid sensor histidine kinase/response regulator [Thiomargarita sp.]
MDKPVILCVDDEQLLVDALKQQLKLQFGNNYQIETAESGSEALEIIEELLEEDIEIPLVISDQLMPGMKGNELLKQIHAIIPKTLKILLTGQADADAVGKAVNNANLYRYIAKPWEPTDFNLTVTEAVHSYFQEKELADFYADLEKKVAKRTEELKQKNEFLGIAVHDLRNPLAAIRGYAEMIKGDSDEAVLQEDTFDLADQIINSSQYMIELIESLLKVNEIESGKMNLSLCVIDILPILQWLTDHYTELAKAKNITLQFQCIEKPYRILANENSLRQVLDNLISNAVKYSLYGKSIYVRLHQDDKWIHCEIQDEGPGLSDEDQQKLFCQFSRLTPQPTGNENSTGLGLFIVKKLVDSMHGKILCDSLLDQGTTFTVAFPIAED